MQSNLGRVINLSAKYSVGSRVSIERFGMSFTSFKFFSEVRPDFIKLDGSYTSNIDEDSNNKFFVRMMVDVADGLASGSSLPVSNAKKKIEPSKTLIDGLQGYYIAQPKPWPLQIRFNTLTG